MNTKSIKAVVSVVLLCFVSQGSLFAQEQFNVLKINSSKELHDFFAYTGNDIPIISGHRGGMIKDYPENSIATFENTLKHIPAFFEVDPRLTKDSVVVLMHDATLERTTTGTGKVSDYTYKELQKLWLKDKFGNITKHKIPTLEEVIIWAKGKTIINLDRKDVPLERTYNIIKKHHAESWVMVTVHSAEQARFYTSKIKGIMMSAFIKTEEELLSYEKASIPFNQMIAYVGPLDLPENKNLYNKLNKKGVMCMVSSASSYDHFPSSKLRQIMYKQVIKGGASILESDLPIEAGKAIQTLMPNDNSKTKYFGKLNLQ